MTDEMEEEENRLRETIWKDIKWLQSSHFSTGTTKSKLRPRTIKYLETLRMYLQCRERMNAKYIQVDEFQTIAKFSIEQELCIERKNQQVSPQDGNPPVSTLEELYAAANLALPVFKQTIQRLVQRVCKECGGGDAVEIVIPPIKARYRAQEKARNDYSQRDRGPAISWLYDMVRGSIKFTSANQIEKCLEILQKKSYDDTIRIVKAKNRFRNPTLTGYRDLNICIQIVVNNDSSMMKHICEVQIHHKEIKQLDEELHSHQYYEYFRSYFAGGNDSLKDRLEDLKLIAGGGGGGMTTTTTDSSALIRLLEEGFDRDVLINLPSHSYLLQEARLDLLASYFCHDLGEYKVALQLYIKLLEVRLIRSGPRHTAVRTMYNHIANIFRDQGKDDSAMTLYRRCLGMEQKLLDTEQHTNIATTYKNMAHVHYHRGELEKALQLYEKCLEIRIKAFGEEHYDVSTALHYIATVQRSQGRYQDAMVLYKRVLSVELNSVGPDHYDIARTYFGMAHAMQGLGKLDAAIELFSKCLEIRQRAFGEDHILVAYAYHAMAVVLKDLGNLERATVMYKNYQEVRKKTLEKDGSVATNDAHDGSDDVLHIVHLKDTTI
mmetsp:Transcript_20466/g.50163  ORF Transcript_20466/g.50163 Transcript_20466/m.50163 type:complete len:605 (+) Transcript_20466:98-1912(+)